MPPFCRRMSAALVFLLLGLGGHSRGGEGEASGELVLLAGGDVQWASQHGGPDVIYENGEYSTWSRLPDLTDGRWRLIPYLNTPQGRAHVSSKLGSSARESRRPSPRWADLAFESPDDRERFPFQKIAPVLRGADVTFVNLENPLSDGSPLRGAFRGNGRFADALAWAGVDVVSVANNHSFDAGEAGLLETLDHLRRAGVSPAGAGRNLNEARQAVFLEQNGVRLVVLAYTQFVNLGVECFANQERSGVAPMDPLLMVEDIGRASRQADIVAVAVHWGSSATREVFERNREFARELLDAGADIVLGGHNPDPMGIEVYKGKVIIYSPGHLIFDHTNPGWSDNHLTRLVLGTEGVKRLEILPVSGRGQDLSQPYLLTGSSATAVLRDVQARSAGLGTSVEIVEDVGVVRLRPAPRPVGQARLPLPTKMFTIRSNFAGHGL